MLRLPPRIDVGFLFDPAELAELGEAEFINAIRSASKALHVNKPMKPSEWAASPKGLRFSGSTTNKSGAVKLYPEQVEIVDATVEPGVELVVLMGVPRIGKSTMITVSASYFSAYEGDDVIIYERNQKALQVVHDTNFWPTMEISPAYEGLIRTGQRNGGVEDKWYDRLLSNGAFQRYRSAEVDGSFRQIRGRRVYISEAGDPAWADGDEGDKIELALKRTQTYPDGAGFMESSPTDAETCTITRWWKISDQRKLFCTCPNPECNAVQELVPSVGDKEGPGLKYVVDADTGRVVDVWYQCIGCDTPIREGSKKQLLASGKWMATNPNGRPGIVGFHEWAIHSRDPKSGWLKIAEKHYEQLHDPSKRQSFKNTWLGLPWERQDQGAISMDALALRAEPYPAEVPDGVIVLTIAGDGQAGTALEEAAGGKDKRMEFMICGWGYGEECWIIDHIIIYGEPYSAAVNTKILEWSNRPWTKRDGTKMQILGGASDVGFNMNEGLNFFNSPVMRQLKFMKGGETFWPVVGKPEAKGSRTILASETQKASSKGRRYLQLGTQSGKDTLEKRKHLTGHGPEVIHFPLSLQRTIGTVYDFFKSMTQIVRRKTKDTGKIWWDDKPGNEVIDCWVYNYAVLQLLKKRYADLSSAMSRMPAEKPQPYNGPDMSHGSDAAQAGTTMIDTRVTARATKVFDNRSSAQVADATLRSMMPGLPPPSPMAQPMQRKKQRVFSVSHGRIG